MTASPDGDDRTVEQRLGDIEMLLEDANILSSLVELTYGMVEVKLALECIEKRLDDAASGPGSAVMTWLRARRRSRPSLRDVKAPR